MSEPSDMDALETIGRTLARLREARGLDIAKAAADLRCDRAIIEALESDRFADLGAAVFARGHLRRYSDFLGAPTEQLLARWSAEQAGGQPLPDLTRAPQAPRPIDTRRWARLLAVVAGALAIGLAAWWILQGAGARPAPTAAASDAPTAPQAVPVPQDLPPAMTTAPTAASEPAVTTEPAAATEPAAVAVTEAVTEAVSTEPTAVAEPAPAAPAVAPGDVAMAFTTAADCWAEVTDAKGSRRLYQLIRAGERVTATGTPPLRVTLGRGDVTRVEIAGRAVAIPQDAVRNAVARFEVAASGAMRALPPVPAPSDPAPSAAPPAEAP
jgi:cytoskeleton protein RodZ